MNGAYEVFSPVSVTALNDYIQNLIAGDEALQTVCVRGEISNITEHRSGHIYFTLKDENSLIRAVMFRREALSLSFRPKAGMRVIAYGRVDVFKANGQYQLYISVMEPDGIGALALMFEELKRKLQAEGLFDANRKKALPSFPQKIGVLTSPTGAAIRDIINILDRRYPLCEVILYPSLVQGMSAPSDIVRGIEWFSSQDDIDLLIFGRGGGSPEDLFAFNTEEVVRAVAACRIPTISAVGHESDVTLSDFAADLRAPTPSAAAELAVPDRYELDRRIAKLSDSALLALSGLIKRNQTKLERLSKSRPLRMPMTLFESRELMLDRLYEKLKNAGDTQLKQAQNKLQSTSAALNALSPLATISRGFAVVYRENEGESFSVTRASDILPNDKLTIQFSDGTVFANAERVQMKSENQKSTKRGRTHEQSKKEADI